MYSLKAYLFSKELCLPPYINLYYRNVECRGSALAFLHSLLDRPPDMRAQLNGLPGETPETGLSNRGLILAGLESFSAEPCEICSCPTQPICKWFTRDKLSLFGEWKISYFIMLIHNLGG